MEHFRRDDLIFDVRDSGPMSASGDTSLTTPGHAPVVLLHGFPQDSSAWTGVTPLLNEAGLRTLAPDLRGYSPKARPAERSAYQLGVIAGDVLALLDAAQAERAHIVGHDWGGGLAWYLAMHHPERVASLTVLSTPHPAAMQWAFLRSAQAVRSWYMVGMQLPWLPEFVLGKGIQVGGLRRLGLDGAHTRAYSDRLRDPGALTGAINWYRGMGTQMLDRIPGRSGNADERDDSDISCPTTYVWGKSDPYLGGTAARATGRHCTGDYLFIELDAGHWLPEKHPRDVAAAIIDRVASVEQFRD